MSKFGRRAIGVAAVLAASVIPVAAAVRSRLVVLAIDESGSMAQSDPSRMRIEAASMMLSIASPQDEVGLIGFGDGARWVAKPGPPRSRMVDSVRQLGQSNQHTTFHAAIELFSDYIGRQDQTYRETHELFLILFTDGRSDPQLGWAAEDRSKSLELVRRIRGRGVVHVISLGHETDGDFLDSVASETGGSRAAADSAGALADAFLVRPWTTTFAKEP
jgi:Mg-chelatase subunit ChlD